MKITTEKITSGEYNVFKYGVFAGTITKLTSGEWIAFDENNEMSGKTNTKKWCLKWCF